MRAALTLVLVSIVSCGDDGAPAGDAGGAADVGTTVDTGPVACIEANGECTAEGSTCCTGLVCRTSSGGRAFCVTPDDTCFVGGEPGCCLDDADCADGTRCHLFECRHSGDGVCKPLPVGTECWSDRDCSGGATCAGAVVCGCGESCFAPDEPGICS